MKMYYYEAFFENVKTKYPTVYSVSPNCTYLSDGMTNFYVPNVIFSLHQVHL